MAQTRFLEKTVRLLEEDCITLEIWSNRYQGDKLKPYIDDVIDELKDCHPKIKVISTQISDHLESRVSPHYGISGYIIKISPGMDLSDLKETCMGLELDKSCNRISDIDVYYKDRKISRKQDT